MKIMKKTGLLVVAEILMISKRMGFNPCGPVGGATLAKFLVRLRNG